MEEKIPEDKLERFLLSSLKQYGDSPSPEVWDRIEAGLRTAPVGVYRRLPWMVGTAAAGLLAVLCIAVVLLVRSNQELKAELRKVQSLVPESKMHDRNEKNTINTGTRTHNGEEHNDLKAPKEGNKADASGPVQELDTLSGSNYQKALLLEKNQMKGVAGSEKRRALKKGEKISEPPAVKDQTAIAANEAPILKVDSQPGSSEEQIKQVENWAVPPQIQAGSLVRNDLGELKREAQSLMSQQVHSPISAATIPARSRISIGFLGGPLSESGTIKPIRPFDPRDTEQAKSEYHAMNSWQAGLELEKVLGPSWSITGGLSYKHFEFVQEIDQKLAFRNREQHHPGRPPLQHDFRYRMQGPAGAAEFEINSEQLDSRATIDDSELIQVNIVNRTALNYLSIPVTAGYHLHFGRWQAFAKAGIQSDLLIHRDAQDPEVRISHPQLALKNNKPRANSQPVNAIGFNGLVQAGVKYRLGSRWGLQLSPSLFLPLTRRDPHIRSNARVYSVQVGLTYAL